MILLDLMVVITQVMPAPGCVESVLLRSGAISESLGSTLGPTGWPGEASLMVGAWPPLPEALSGDPSVVALAAWTAGDDRRAPASVAAAHTAFERHPRGAGSELLGVAAMADRTSSVRVAHRLFNARGAGGSLAARWTACHPAVLSELNGRALAAVTLAMTPVERSMSAEVAVEVHGNLALEWARRGDVDQAAAVLRRLESVATERPCALTPRPADRSFECAFEVARVAAFASALPIGALPEWDEHPSTQFAREAATCATTACERISFRWGAEAWEPAHGDDCVRRVLDRYVPDGDLDGMGVALFAGACGASGGSVQPPPR